MRIYDKGKFVVYEYHFNSLDNFLTYIQEGSTNTKSFDEWDLSSIKGSYDFTKTESLDEAIRLCKYGWNEDFERLLSLKTTVDKKFLNLDTSESLVVSSKKKEKNERLYWICSFYSRLFKE